MRIHLSIFNFSIIVLYLGSIALPSILVESYLIPKYSSLVSNIRFNHFVLEQSKDRKVILLGESTIRTLHSSKQEVMEDKLISNLSLPGSLGSEALEMLKIAIDRNPSYEAVIYGTFQPMGIEGVAPADRYTPGLVSSTEIIQRIKSGEITFSEGLIFFSRKTLTILNGRDEVIERLLSEWNIDLSGLLRKIKEGRALRAQLKPREIVMSNPNPFLQIVELTKAKKMRFILMFTPYASSARSQEGFRELHGHFRKLCALPIECWDFTDKLPDEVFESDGFHYRTPGVAPYRSLIHDKFKKLSNSNSRN